ncbi:RHS repeat-associated core domain-containing protein [Ascidiimonas aurantiaca]|uniref:RHS repeat-associated core domain-containing protein n=1 Tax=Ascidiimonas aurantiaca TaxID=1685432 RepID=UPI0030EB2467
MNLPLQIDFGGGNTVNYVYDATGGKLKKTVTDVANGITETQYARKFVYKNNTLEFFHHAEGYIEPMTNGDFSYIYQSKDHLGNVRLSYADTDGNGLIDIGEIKEENNYYPFGLKHKGYNSGINGRDHTFEYNGKEIQEELGLNWYDYGARMYDATLGRWHSTDNKAEFYFANSPYIYALNTPIQAIDPDGNLVIFINGLGGGGKNYWRGYRTEFYTYTNPKNNWRYNAFRKVPYAFDISVSNHFDDHNRMYIDGSPGSIFNNFTTGQRFKQDYDNGLKLAESIIRSLARDPQGNITETIKVITHSMGGVYGKGFVAALKYYIKTSKDPQVRKTLVSLVADFDPFQAGRRLGKADNNIYTQQFINSAWWSIFDAGWLANEEEEDADEVTNNPNKTSHFIETFIDNVNDLQEGTYEWNEDDQEWICTSCKNN